MDIKSNYTKFRWIFTSTNKLVVGGKSAEQNDLLISELKKTNKDYIVMHTSSPASPFTVIFSDINKVSDKELKEVATFTACFSRSWALKKKEVSVDIFNLSSLFKDKTMKSGTWLVKGKVKRILVEVYLVVTKQKGVLRAVPKETIKSEKEIFFSIIPGNLDKNSLYPKLALEFEKFFNQEELLSALPSGGIKLIK